MALKVEEIPINKRFLAQCSDGVERLCIKYKKDTYPHWDLIKVLEENGAKPTDTKAVDVKILSIKVMNE